MIEVSTLEGLVAAVASNSSKIVVISGTITGNAVVYVESNTSVFGRPGASKSIHETAYYQSTTNSNFRPRGYWTSYPRKT